MGTIINVYAMPVFLKEEYDRCLGLLVFEQSGYFYYLREVQMEAETGLRARSFI